MIGMGVRRILRKTEMEKSLGMLPFGRMKVDILKKWTWQKYLMAICNPIARIMCAMRFHLTNIEPSGLIHFGTEILFKV